MDRIGGGFEPRVQFVMPVSERVCQVRIPVVLGDGQSRRVEIEPSVQIGNSAQRIRNEAGEPKDSGHGRDTAASRLAQQLGLESDPPVHRNLGLLKHRGKKTGDRHALEGTAQGPSLGSDRSWRRPQLPSPIADALVTVSYTSYPFVLRGTSP